MSSHVRLYRQILKRTVPVKPRNRNLGNFLQSEEKLPNIILSILFFFLKIQNFENFEIFLSNFHKFLGLTGANRFKPLQFIVYHTLFLLSLELNEADAEIKESFQLLLKVWKLCQIIFIKSSPCNNNNDSLIFFKIKHFKFIFSWCSID